MARVSFEFKKGDFVWIGLIVVLLCVGFGVAYNSGVDPSVMGHSAEEVEVAEEYEYTYVKTIMKAKFSIQNDFNIFVMGQPGQDCTEVCASIPRPSTVCGSGTFPCRASFFEVNRVERSYPPYSDPYFSNCDSVKVDYGSMCMCGLTGCGWTDDVFNLSDGVSFW